MLPGGCSLSSSAYSGSVADVVELARQGTLADRIAEFVRYNTWQSASKSEQRSWERSLPVLANDLVAAGLSNVEMLIEYQLPLTSRRADVVLAGVHPTTGEDTYVIVELKQWSAADLWEDDSSLVLVQDMPGGPKLHPSLQVRGYCEYTADYLTQLAEHNDRLCGVAYLHNAMDADVFDLFDHVQDDWSRLFTRQRRDEFMSFLKSRLSPEPGAAAGKRLLASAVRPSKNLMRIAAKEVRDREQFVLLDEQQVAYRMVLHAVQKARKSDHKTAVVVTGGPGSGKSAIALSLLGEQFREQRPTVHATGSKSFTRTLRKQAGKGSTRVQNLFKYFNNFMDAEANDLDVLVCDEAHRIRRQSANRYTPKAVRERSGAQIDELLSAARVPVFLLDEHQVVRPGETGTVDSIHWHAEQRGIDVELVSLHDQFRCGGSEAYEQWILDLLGFEGRTPQKWHGDDRFELDLVETPTQLEERLRTKGTDTARMSAGFCWPWSQPRDDGSLVEDVVIGDWARPWNAKSDRTIGDAPESSLWATDPRGFGQVGCVYTAQGFEYDWSGVILGPDLVYRDGKLITRREYNKDPDLRKKTVLDSDVDRLIRNIYKVLLTRGMKGTTLYSTDPETRAFLTDLVRR